MGGREGQAVERYRRGKNHRDELSAGAKRRQRWRWRGGDGHGEAERE